MHANIKSYVSKRSIFLKGSSISFNKFNNFSKYIYSKSEIYPKSVGSELKLGKSINLDAFEPLVKASIKCKISKFIYASSSSIYGNTKLYPFND